LFDNGLDQPPPSKAAEQIEVEVWVRKLLIQATANDVRFEADIFNIADKNAALSSARQNQGLTRKQKVALRQKRAIALLSAKRDTVHLHIDQAWVSEEFPHVDHFGSGPANGLRLRQPIPQRN
jgi:hypothetical protein